MHRQDAKHNTSPVFGLARIILPEKSVRNFSTRFLQLKKNIFYADIKKANAFGFKWEKKGSDIFRPKAMERYPELRGLGFRLLNSLGQADGHAFYYGIEKEIGKLDGNPVGLYTTALAHAIRRLDQHCQEMKTNFVLVVDQHSAHHDLLECAAKTMFGQDPARRLLSPPFQVESYLNQTMQAADLMASIVGRLWAYELQPQQYQDHKPTRDYFWDRLHRLTVHSAVNKRKSKRPPRFLPYDPLEVQLRPYPQLLQRRHLPKISLTNFCARSTVFSSHRPRAVMQCQTLATTFRTVESCQFPPLALRAAEMARGVVAPATCI